MKKLRSQGIKELFKSHTAKQQLGIKLNFKCFKVNHKVMIKHNVYIYPEVNACVSPYSPAVGKQKSVLVILSPNKALSKGSFYQSSLSLVALKQIEPTYVYVCVLLSAVLK